MSALLRARLSAFLAGVAVAGVFGVYQLRGDVAEGQEKLLQQVSCAAVHRGGSLLKLVLEYAACKLSFRQEPGTIFSSASLGFCLPHPCPRKMNCHVPMPWSYLLCSCPPTDQAVRLGA